MARTSKPLCTYSLIPGMNTSIAGASSTTNANSSFQESTVAGKISKQEAKKKTGPKAVKWSVTASGRRRKKAAEGGMIHRGRRAEYEV